uniref:Uncharacterized protein n=1 Tax=Panagrolaimus superbus TaxID=310955 RepID=A0A914Y8L6_9BILA
MGSPIISHEQIRNSDTPKSSPRLLIHPTPSYLLLLDEMDKNDTESSPSTDSINLDDLPPPHISRFNSAQLPRLPMDFIEDYPYHRPASSRDAYTENPLIQNAERNSNGSRASSSRQNYSLGTPILGRAINNMSSPGGSRRLPQQLPSSPVGTPRFRISMSPPKNSSQDSTPDRSRRLILRTASNPRSGGGGRDPPSSLPRRNPRAPHRTHSQQTTV